MGGNISQIFESDQKQHAGNLQMLQNLEQVIFDLNDKNIDDTIGSLLANFPQEFPYSYNLIISNLTYSYYISKGLDQLCLEFLKKLELKENEIGLNNNKIIDIFIKCLISKDTQESNFLLEKMIENNMADPLICKDKSTPYFAHRISIDKIKKIKSNKSYRYFLESIEELSKNDWQLHKQYVKEGHNPNEIARIIRNDEIEKLQEISSQTNFDFNQKIKPSLYERCSFINDGCVTLIGYAAFFSSVNCFKYLLMNGANVKKTGKYAVAGGNEEIIHLCIQNHSEFDDVYETAIKFHRNDIFKYIFENRIKQIYSFRGWELIVFYIIIMKLFHFCLK